MTQTWIDADPGVTAGVVGFLVEHHNTRHSVSSLCLEDRPAHGNQSPAPHLHGWCGTFNDVATYARGVVRVDQVLSNGRALVQELAGDELHAALQALGYPELQEQAPEDAATTTLATHQFGGSLQQFQRWLTDRMAWHAAGMQGSGDPQGHARRRELYRAAAEVVQEFVQEAQP